MKTNLYLSADRVPRRQGRWARRLLVSLLMLGCWSPPAMQGMTRTVCASGCNYNSLQQAIDAAEGGDVIEVAAGEVFEENILLPHKWTSDYITIRSSRWTELPAEGNRVNPADHAALMPLIRPSANAPVVRVGEDARRVNENGVNVANNTLSFDNSFTVGTWVSCAGNSLPAPLEYGRPYMIKESNGSIVKLSLGDEQPVIDLTGVGSAASNNYYARPFCTKWFSGHHYRFTGIDFSAKTGMYTNILVMIGWDEAAVDSVPHDIEFDRVLVRGLPEENGPRFCMALNGRRINVTDSWIGHCKAFSDESKGISLVNSPGPTLLKNNYISAASIGILTAGQGSSIFQQVATGLSIVNNHIVKQGYMMYKSGAGPPSGSCYYGNGSGSFYRNTTPSPNTCANGACYECQPNATWAQNTSATYRNAHYLTKGGVEFKDCDNCLVEGNIIEAVFAGPDAGNTPCMSLFQGFQGGGYHFIGDTTVRNNWCKDTWNGFGVANDGHPELTTPNRRITFENNLITGMGRFPEMSIWPNNSDVPVRSVMISNGQEGVIFNHNTFRYATYQGQFGFGFLNGPAAWGSLKGFLLANSLIQAGFYNIYQDGDYSCGTGGLGKYISADVPRIVNIALYGGTGGAPFTSCPGVQNLVQPSESSVGFVSSTNPRLSPTSPYSASCSSGCAFAGNDGKDLGADVDLVEEAVSGVLAGKPRWSEQAQLRVDPGSRYAVVSYAAPDENGCSLNVYTSAGRTPASEHPDTSASGRSLDSRAGNLANGLYREFVLGTGTQLNANTEYYYVLRCGSRVMPGRFRTQPSGAGTFQYTITVTDDSADNAILEYSTDATLQNPTVSAPVAFATVGGVRRVEFKLPVAAGQLLYARWKKRDAANGVIATGPLLPYATK